jgi:hypothetical protein
MGTFELDGLITIDTPHYDIGEILVFLADHEYQRDALVAKVKAIGGKAMCRILADFIQQDEDGSATTLLVLMGELDMHDFTDLEDRARILLFLGSVEYPPERLEAIIQKLDEEELSLVFRRSGNLQNCSRKRKEFLDSCARIHGSTLVKGHHEVIFPAASNGDRLTLEFFFERCNVSTDVTDKQFHQTALSHAAEHGCLGVVKYLLGIGASVKSRDKKGRTALWWAAREGKTEVVKELLLSDAVIEADMIETCSKYGHHDIAQLLSQASSNTSSE